MAIFLFSRKISSDPLIFFASERSVQDSPRHGGKKEGAYTLTFSALIPEAFLKLLQGGFILLEPAASLICGIAYFMTVLMSVVHLRLRRVHWAVRKILGCIFF